VQPRDGCPVADANEAARIDALESLLLRGWDSNATTDDRRCARPSPLRSSTVRSSECRALPVKPGFQTTSESSVSGMRGRYAKALCQTGPIPVGFAYEVLACRRWAQIAIRLGMPSIHLIAEFKEFSGLTPHAFAARRCSIHLWNAPLHRQRTGRSRWQRPLHAVTSPGAETDS